MSGHIAVIDLGTNTFHLLIAEAVTGTPAYTTRKTIPVKLGEGGINAGIIQPEAFARGLHAMQLFAADIKAAQVKETRAIATSAIRNAANGQQFIDEVKRRTGIAIEIIDGLREAALIYRGVRASGALGPDNTLIVDIGGGSVECILCNNRSLLWKHSFEIGAARMMDRFHKTDPLPPGQLAALQAWLTTELQQLWLAAENIPVKQLVGSAGAFETFAEMIEAEQGRPFSAEQAVTYNFVLDDFNRIAGRLRQSSHAERLQMKGIIPLRTDMIVTASVLTGLITQRLGIIRLAMSAYSLKEGVLAELCGA